MRRLGAVLLAGMLAVAGCSGDSGDRGTAPSIFNLVSFPREFRVGDGGGAVSVNLLFNFEDADGDLAEYVLTTPAGTQRGRFLRSLDGVTIGIAGFPAVVATTAAGEFACTVAATDARGNTSNSLSFTYAVR